MNTNNTVYTLSEVAEKLRVSHDTVIQLIQDNKLEAFKVGSRWRVSIDAFDLYLNREVQAMKKEMNARIFARNNPHVVKTYVDG